MVALAIANDNPQILLEHVFTTAPDTNANLPRGHPLPLEKTKDLSAIIHIERTEGGHLQFTAVSLLYGFWGLRGSVGVFAMEPPPGLNLESTLPIIRGNMRQEWLQTFAELRRSKPVPAEGDKAAAASGPALVRVDTGKPGEKVPETGALPDLPVATPMPLKKALCDPKFRAVTDRRPGRTHRSRCAG